MDWIQFCNGEYGISAIVKEGKTFKKQIVELAYFEFKILWVLKIYHGTRHVSQMLYIYYLELYPEQVIRTCLSLICIQ